MVAAGLRQRDSPAVGRGLENAHHDLDDVPAFITAARMIAVFV